MTVVREKGDTVRVTCPACDGEGAHPRPAVPRRGAQSDVQMETCGLCDGECTIMAELAEEIRVDVEAILEDQNRRVP